jgi:protein SCO1
MRRTVLVGISSLAGIGLLMLVFVLARQHTLHGAVIDPPAPVTDFQLTDQSGQPFRMSSLRGQVVFLYFGYTNCPDECPLTMAHLKLAVSSLGAQATQVKVVMVTTDPARDTAGQLKDWLGKFDPDFIGLYGTPDQLAAVYKAYGVAVEDGGETHGDFTYVIDRQGDLRETFLPDSNPQDEGSDMSLLLGGN